MRGLRRPDRAARRGRRGVAADDRADLCRAPAAQLASSTPAAGTGPRSPRPQADLHRAVRRGRAGPVRGVQRRLGEALPGDRAAVDRRLGGVRAVPAFDADIRKIIWTTNAIVTSSSTRRVHDVQHEALSGWDRRRGRGYLLHRPVRRRCGGARARAAGAVTCVGSVVDRSR